MTRLDPISERFAAGIASALARGLADLSRCARLVIALRREGVDRRDLAEWAALGTPALPLLEALRADFAARRAWAIRSGEVACRGRHDVCPCHHCGAVT